MSLEFNMCESSASIHKDAAPFAGISIALSAVGGSDAASFEFLAASSADKVINEHQFSRYELVGRCDSMSVFDESLFAPGLGAVRLSPKLTSSTFRWVAMGNF